MVYARVRPTYIYILAYAYNIRIRETAELIFNRRKRVRTACRIKYIALSSGHNEKTNKSYSPTCISGA